MHFHDTEPVKHNDMFLLYLLPIFAAPKWAKISWRMFQTALAFTSYLLSSSLHFCSLWLIVLLLTPLQIYWLDSFSPLLSVPFPGSREWHKVRSQLLKIVKHLAGKEAKRILWFKFKLSVFIHTYILHLLLLIFSQRCVTDKIRNIRNCWDRREFVFSI